jgi:hypothetical protein
MESHARGDIGIETHGCSIEAVLSKCNWLRDAGTTSARGTSVIDQRRTRRAALPQCPLDLEVNDGVRIIKAPSSGASSGRRRCTPASRSEQKG